MRCFNSDPQLISFGLNRNSVVQALEFETDLVVMVVVVLLEYCCCNKNVWILEVQLDLGYLATSYPESLLSGRDLAVYTIYFFIHFHMYKILFKTNTKWINFCFISFYIHFIWTIICYKYTSNK